MNKQIDEYVDIWIDILTSMKNIIVENGISSIHKADSSTKVITEINEGYRTWNPGLNIFWMAFELQVQGAVVGRLGAIYFCGMLGTPGRIHGRIHGPGPPSWDLFWFPWHSWVIFQPFDCQRIRWKYGEASDDWAWSFTQQRPERTSWNETELGLHLRLHYNKN